jgi:hypothetical protein
MNPREFSVEDLEKALRMMKEENLSFDEACKRIGAARRGPNAAPLDPTEAPVAEYPIELTDSEGDDANKLALDRVTSFMRENGVSYERAVATLFPVATREEQQRAFYTRDEISRMPRDTLDPDETAEEFGERRRLDGALAYQRRFPSSSWESCMITYQLEGRLPEPAPPQPGFLPGGETLEDGAGALEEEDEGEGEGEPSEEHVAYALDLMRKHRIGWTEALTRARKPRRIPKPQPTLFRD